MPVSYGSPHKTGTIVSTMPSTIPRQARAMQLVATVSILVMSMIWGSTFFSIKVLVARVPVADMLAVRFWVAALVLGVVGWRSWRMSRRTALNGLLLGLVWGVAQLFQTFGIDGTSASLSGFITGLAVVITPLITAGVLREQVNGWTWGAVVLATLGLGVLSLNLSGGAVFGLGETLTLVSAFLYAVHIVMAGHVSTPREAMSLVLVQTPVTAAICSLAALPGGVVLPTSAADWGWLLYLAVIAGALTIFLQVWAQAHVEPTRAAVIMATEPVWAATFAVWLGGEQLTWRILLGGLTIVAAMVLVVVVPALRQRSGDPVA